MAGRENGLPPKESTLFKSIVKHYETKQYKKGLKAADAVLKKVPEHGETLAMKGLILNCLERKTEAYELVRRGVKQDIKSHVCWHVYGLLYRSDREYLQAIKCYRGALRHDPENIQILRDLSLLQVQMRDRLGFVETRQKLLALKPTNRNNWFTFALAQQLCDERGAALGIVDSYEATLEGAPEQEPYEQSEMLLYKNMLLEEDGQAAAALAHLDERESEIVDKKGMLEKRGELLVQLGRHAEAEPVYRELVGRNPEHYGYHAGLTACVLKLTVAHESWLGVQLDASQVGVLKDLYAELQHKNPKSSVCRRLPLDFARDADHFRVAAKTYLLPSLRKGVPSIFSDLKPLYADAMKAETLGTLFRDWLASLAQDGTLRGESKREMPTTVLWVRVLLAQHNDKVGDTAGALSEIDAAIDHSPTLLDLYMLKARIFKHAGALAEASSWMDKARCMDLADRYLNTKATRYMLRADQLEEAEACIALFTKDGDNPSNLFDMQCMWYELEVANCHARRAEWGKALKNWSSVDKHFTDIIEDQFDFHTYCIRKMTLRAYVNMLRLEDGLHGHRFYVEAALASIGTYLRLVDAPKGAAASAADDGLDALSAADRKKAESKRRKAEAKAKAEADAAAKAPAAGAANKKKGGKEAKEDADPDGAALAAAAEPLEVASGFLRTLQRHAPSELRTQTLGCDVATRKGRYLLALQSLRKAVALSPDDPSVHRCAVRFLHTVECAKATVHPNVAAVIASNRDAIGAPASKSLSELNVAFVARCHGGADATLAAAEMQLLIDPAQRAAALRAVAALDVQGLSLAQAVATHELLARTFSDASAAGAFKAKAHARFPHATCFQTPAAPAA